ncbi:NtaA/DmoA family FMN-dependent monooxygenase (plasmid) [Streptomyces jietaisiensis]|uniref:NtaA/DmoA family FMN-dependent monooxygenase n=1 Tax=Streptomyces griseoaurantiacus TaxID=68213 RepID=UPI002F90CCBD
MAVKPFHLGWFLGGSKVQGWRQRWSGNDPQNWMSADLYLHVIRELERACFDYVLFEDNFQVADRFGNSTDVYVRNALSTPRQDPAVLAAMVAATTSRIGIVPTLPTFAYHPYLLSRMLGTLDQVSGGRAGWNVVTGSSDRAYQNFGHEKMPGHDLRYDIAAEFVDLATSLWGSWEPDAIVGDQEAGIFADHQKIHRVDFQGKWFASRGPLNSGPLPQGKPVIAQAGSSPKGRRFAAKYADTVVAEAHTVEDMKAYRDDIHRLMIEFGRDPQQCKVLFTVCPILGATDEDAQEVKARRAIEAQDKVEATLGIISNLTDIDFSVFPLDEPLGEREWETQGTRATLDTFIDQNRGKTLREAAVDMQTSIDGAFGLVGSPETVAGRMCELVEEIGGDGFLLANDVLTRRDIAEFVDGLVPALQRRKAVRTAYTHEHFRDNLLEF